MTDHYEFHSSLSARVDIDRDGGDWRLSIPSGPFYSPETLRDLAFWIAGVADKIDAEPRTIPARECIPGKVYRAINSVYSSHMDVDLLCLEERCFRPLSMSGPWERHEDKALCYFGGDQMIPVE